MKDNLKFKDLAQANITRAKRWHKGSIEQWSISDWAVAMAGEAGEVCNAVKKLRRIEEEISNISDSERQLSTKAEAIKKIRDEIADTVIYLDLLAQRIGVNLSEAIILKFNETSAKYNFPERLGEES